MKKKYLFLLSIVLIFSLAGCYKKVNAPLEMSKANIENSLSTMSFRPDPDSVSAASDTAYFSGNTLSVEELYETIHNLSGGAIAVSTVNSDGSPNLAYVGPDMVDDEILMFGLSNNQTRKNIIERKIAVAGVYLYDPDWEGGLSDSRGARLVLKLIEDKNVIEQLKQRVPEAPEDVLFMKIIRILPVG